MSLSLMLDLSVSAVRRARLIRALDGLFNAKGGRRMKHKAVYFSIACATIILGVAFASHLYFNRITFDCVSVADGIDGSWEQEWESSDGVTVYESKSYYSSVEDAKAAFEKRLEGATRIIERKRLSTEEERVVGLFNSQESERAVSIIELKNKGVYRVAAPSLKYAFLFEKYRSENPE